MSSVSIFCSENEDECIIPQRSLEPAISLDHVNMPWEDEPLSPRAIHQQILPAVGNGSQKLLGMSLAEIVETEQEVFHVSNLRKEVSVQQKDISLFYVI